MKRVVLLILAIAPAAWPQGMQEIVAQGEKVFNQTCATGYCHALKGGSTGGAPRLAARGFDEAFINTTTSRGVAGTAMPGFAMVLSRGDLVAVVSYVATLNGVTPTGNPGGRGGAPAGAGAGGGRGGRGGGPALSAEAAAGRTLFFEATKSFSRCSTCHEMGTQGIPVATPIANIPASATALRSLATPHVATATMNGDAMPAMVLSQSKTKTVFYDLTTSPPVLRTADPGSVKISEGSGWKHSAAIAAYSDAELASIITFLNAAAKQ